MCMPSIIVNACKICCDDRFAAQQIFHALDWIETDAVVSSVHFSERKHFKEKSLQVNQ